MNILKFKKEITNKTYLAVSVLGKSLKLNIKYLNTNVIELNQKENEIDLILPRTYKGKDNTQIINMSVEKLYNKIADIEVEYAMEIARHILKFAPEDYQIKRLNNEYYKCVKKQIIINPDIVRFNREIINTTIIQAFCKIKYRSNSISYKKLLNFAMNQYELYKNNQNKKDIILKVS